MQRSKTLKTLKQFIPEERKVGCGACCISLFFLILMMSFFMLNLLSPDFIESLSIPTAYVPAVIAAVFFILSLIFNCISNKANRRLKRGHDGCLPGSVKLLGALNYLTCGGMIALTLGSVIPNPFDEILAGLLEGFNKLQTIMICSAFCMLQGIVLLIDSWSACGQRPPSNKIVVRLPENREQAPRLVSAPMLYGYGS
eukprot:gnl/Dysnectes_brevis/126_a149_8803.p1 GENE.gnl/Dysnectes_brevis/126_a149_8803~~gnl/Dysnectes_brevis/126_a149_8803.p1  ORF type:complete len:198 (-),score=38.16 gnl/Dysnectes_brevis/126_a149_8803:75-668(-)